MVNQNYRPTVLKPNNINIILYNSILTLCYSTITAPNIRSIQVFSLANLCSDLVGWRLSGNKMRSPDSMYVRECVTPRPNRCNKTNRRAKELSVKWSNQPLSLRGHIGHVVKRTKGVSTNHTYPQMLPI